jgi:tetratricopeptide (TPR) repeat protein
MNRMPSGKINSKISILFLLLIQICINFSCRYACAYEFSAWEHGISGYENAYSVAMKNDKPLVVYFHIEGSIWNERMNDEYLATGLIENYLMDIPKVEINGEDDDPEKKLESKYGVKQFPAFFVIVPSIDDKPARIHPFSNTEMSVEEFLEKIKETIAFQYSSKAFSCFEKKEYDNALKYYMMSSDYNPEDAYTYHAIGTIYSYKYYNGDKSIEYLKSARDSFQKAIELNPDSEDSKIELEKLEKELGRQEES